MHRSHRTPSIRLTLTVVLAFVSEWGALAGASFLLRTGHPLPALAVAGLACVACFVFASKN